MSGLASKIDELLRNQRAAKQRKKAKSAFAEAKRQYSAYRKKALANLKQENAAIKKRESEKIKRMPKKDRVAARKRLREALKARTDKLKKKLPGKVSTPGEMRNLMSSFRTLKV